MARLKSWIACNVFNRHLWVRFQFEHGAETRPFCWYCGRWE